jgi:hypothetical protein
VRGHALAGVACRRRQKKYESPREHAGGRCRAPRTALNATFARAVMQAQSETLRANRSMVAMLLGCGLRRSELLSETVLIN